MVWMTITLLAGCQYLEEQRELPTEVTWDGYVLAQLSDSTEAEVLDVGAVTLLDLDGAPLVAAEHLGNGYWRAEDVPVDLDVAIRLEGPTASTDTLPLMTPTVWRGRTPTGRASWLTGALYLRDLDYTDAFLTALEAFPGVDIPTLADGESAVLWGEPWDAQAWAGASLSVTDGAGEDAPVIALMLAEDGSMAEAGEGDPIDLFVAWDLSPGTVTLDVEAADGRTVSETWPAEAGELLSAIYMALPEDS